LGKSEIIKLVREYKIIDPFDERLLDGDSYVLTVEKSIELNYLEHQNVISHEIIFLPSNIVAHLTAKSKFGRMGLSFLNAAKVHSGFIGRLVLEIVNLSNSRKPIVIEKGEQFMHIEFIERKGEPSPYEGEYQFQYMSKEEIEKYLPYLKKAFGNEFDRLSKVWRISGKL
jgi:dCTP deaminase